MKKFLTVIAILLGFVLTIAYLSFLFVLPNIVDLNQYKPTVQKLVKEQIPLNIDFKDLKITTTPMLSIGIKANDISVKFEDGSTLFSADKAKFRVALPSILLFTVKVSTAEIDNPNLNFDIIDGKQFKILMIVEKLLQQKELADDDFTETPQTTTVPFDASIIRIKVPNIILNNYKILITDKKTNHNLSLNGERLNVGYFNGKVAKLKTQAEFKSDNDKNITADININTFLPKFEPSLDAEDDKPERIELPFINPVLTYREYNLKSNIVTKLKIREKKGIYKLNGFVNIDDTTLNLANYQLPKCYFHGTFKGTKAEIDTHIPVVKNEAFNINGNINYGKNPKIDMQIKSDKIFIHDLLLLAKAYLDSLHIRNDLALIKGNGYIEANADIKSNMKKLISSGSIIVRDGAIVNKNLNSGITKTNVNLLLDNNTLNIKDTYTYINNALLKVDGKIDEESNIDISINAKSIPIVELYRAFAPSNIKKSIIISSGNVSLNSKISGKMKQATCNLNTKLSNFVMHDNSGAYIVSNAETGLNLKADKDNIITKIKNNGLQIYIPQSNSIIANNSLNVDIQNTITTINPTDIIINKNSKIKVQGLIDSNKIKPIIDIKANGTLNAQDLKKFAGNSAAQFIEANGNLPLTATLNGNMKRQDLILRVLASPSNYITPVKLNQMLNKNSVLQAKIDFKGNRLKIKETGLFIKTTTTDSEGNEIEHLDKVLGISGTITNLKSVPFINVIKITVPKHLNGSIVGFKNSNFMIDPSRLFIFGNSKSPFYRGHLNISNIYIRDLLMTLDKINLTFNNTNLNVLVQNLNLNDSDFTTNLNYSLIPSNIAKISNLRVTSRNIDLDKLLKVQNAITKTIPQQNNSKASTTVAPIPVIVKNGSIKFDKIKTGNIILRNTNSRLALRKSRLYLNNLTTNAFSGYINGKISMNLLNLKLNIKLKGQNIDTNKMLLATANMKDTLSGKTSFATDILFDASKTTYEAQMKALKGNVNFSITNGQFGPFGKVENLILAENIRNSQFFQTAVGGIINDLTSIDTTHFNNLNGELTFNDGITTINSITTDGKVLTLYITGKFNLLENTTDMSVRGRLASMLSNALGPIANVNPVNLVKITPGLNIASAKLFSIFTQPVTLEELNKIPAFSTKTDNFNATNFQVILNGNVAKPLNLVKSFKWLALQDQINSAMIFVSSLPEPETINSTVEEMQAQQAKNAKTTTKIKNSILKKEQKLQEQQKLETQEALKKIQQQAESNAKNEINIE